MLIDRVNAENCDRGKSNIAGPYTHWLRLGDGTDATCFCLAFYEIISPWRFNFTLSGTPLRLGKMQENIALRLNAEPQCF
jgi:hypothetical protein